MNTQSLPGTLISFEATDGLALQGSLFEPRRKTPKALIFVHGTGGSSFLKSFGRTALWARQLNAAGIAFFPFDNRGAHVVMQAKINGNRKRVGAAFEVIADCIFDIQGAVALIHRRGYRQIYLAGHSTGANKVVIYSGHTADTRVQACFLLGGGDDTGLLWRELGPKRAQRYLRQASGAVARGQGDALFLAKDFGHLYSNKALLDVIDPNGDYNIFPFYEARYKKLGWKMIKPIFGELRECRHRCICIYGQHDPYCGVPAARALERLHKLLPQGYSHRSYLVPQTGHSFEGKLARVATIMRREIERR